MPRTILSLVVAAALVAAFGVGYSVAADRVVMENEYIRLSVNATPSETGRFGVETTGGDPRNPNDSNSPLVYGRPVPWTSYTTVRIDNTDWVFGGPASRRAGKRGQYGQIVSGPIVSGNAIVTKVKMGDILVTQELSFVKSPTTRYMDTARILYKVQNEGTSSRSIGLRIMLDTMLGANDGAPLRAYESEILTDTVFRGSEVPDYFQAFDSLTEPSVTSQGTLRGGELTPPSRLAFTNWGNAADNTWEVDLVPGRDFTREGEMELDSAALIYWDPSSVEPGTTRNFVIYYGLGGITLAPGRLSIGVTSPAEVNLAEGTVPVFTAVAYVQNRGEGPAHDVEVAITLPDGLRLVSGQRASRPLGDLEPGQTAQAAWQIMATGMVIGELRFVVSVQAKNADPNEISRTVEILGPPRIAVAMVAPRALEVRNERRYPDPARVSLAVRNLGGSPAYWVSAELAESVEYGLAKAEKAVKEIGHLEPGSEFLVPWYITDFKEAGVAEIKAVVKSANTLAVTGLSSMRVPELIPKITVVPVATQATVGGFVSVDVVATNIPDLHSVSFDLRYDPGLLTHIHTSRGPVFVVENTLLEWDRGQVLQSAGTVRGTKGAIPGGTYAFGALARFDFIVRETGSARVWVENVLLMDASGNEIHAIIGAGNIRLTR